MTYEEYKALAREYNTTDSISRRDELENKIKTAAVALAWHLQKMYCRYGRRFVDDSDWQEGRGGYGLTYANEKQIELHYGDHWAYGGECDIDITIPANMFDASVREEEERKLLNKYLEWLKLRSGKITTEIERLESEQKDIISKIARFEHGDYSFVGREPIDCIED